MKSIVRRTPLELNYRLSLQYNANIYLKREDMQPTRSFEIRGAYQKITTLQQVKKGTNIHVVSFLSGNHALSVAYVCYNLGIQCTIVIPLCTSMHDKTRIQELGGELLNLVEFGYTNEEVRDYAFEYANTNDYCIIDPLNDLSSIKGLQNISGEMDSFVPDIIVCPVQGGGLISGQLLYRSESLNDYKIIGVEPVGADCMHQSLTLQKITKIDNIDTFVDNTGISEPGALSFEICQNLLDTEIVLVDNNEVSYHLVKLYQDDGIIVEPSGALSVCALEQISKKYNINEKNVVCIISAGNNDIMRYSEYIERSLVYQQLIHYYIIRFDQRPGALEHFIQNVMSGTGIDIIRFEYLKKTNKTHGSVLLGIEMKSKSDLEKFVSRLVLNKIKYNYIEPNNPLFDFIV